MAHPESRWGDKTRLVRTLLRDGERDKFVIKRKAGCSDQLVAVVAREMKIVLPRRQQTTRARVFNAVPLLVEVPRKAGLADPAVGVNTSIVNPLRPITYTEQENARELKELRLRRELARQLDEIWRRQQALWGSF